jgi:hypothetical protein
MLSRFCCSERRTLVSSRLPGVLAAAIAPFSFPVSAGFSNFFGSGLLSSTGEGGGGGGGWLASFSFGSSFACVSFGDGAGAGVEPEAEE